MLFVTHILTICERTEEAKLGARGLPVNTGIRTKEKRATTYIHQQPKGCVILVLKANTLSWKSGESFRFSLFPFINMYFDRILLVDWCRWKSIVFNSSLLSENYLKPSYKKKITVSVLNGYRPVLLPWLLALIKGCHLLSCLASRFQLRLINRCYLDIPLPFILFICISAQLCLPSASSMLADWLASNLDKLLIFPAT